MDKKPVKQIPPEHVPIAQIVTEAARYIRALAVLSSDAEVERLIDKYIAEQQAKTCSKRPLKKGKHIIKRGKR